MKTIYFKIKNQNNNWIYGYASRLPQDAIEITEKQFSKYIEDEKNAMDKWAGEYELTQAPIIESAKSKLKAIGLTEEEIKLLIK